MELVEILLAGMLAMAVLATVARKVGIAYPVLLVLGGLYYAIVQRRRGVETLPEHRPESFDPGPKRAATNPVIDGHWLGRLAANE